jgi:hypothetical protein
MSLPMDRASAISVKHQRDSTDDSVAANTTASARRSAEYSSRSQFRPAGIP